MKTIQHFVNGKSFSGESKKVGKIFNPATGEQEADVKLATTKDINYAVANKPAFPYKFSINTKILLKYYCLV